VVSSVTCLVSTVTIVGTVAEVTVRLKIGGKWQAVVHVEKSMGPIVRSHNN
jgi:hypothetical protein